MNMMARFGLSDSSVPGESRREVREQLERYCGQDTEGMVWIIDALRKLAV